MANYDVGLRVYDEFVKDLLDVFRQRTTGSLFVFMTSDHNELFGEQGLFGHGHSDQAISALAPFSLYTNRPDHAVARAFAKNDSPDAFFVSSLVMRLIGVLPKIDPGLEGSTFICNCLPAARSGYMRVLPPAMDGVRAVEHYSRAGRKTHISELSLS